MSPLLRLFRPVNAVMAIIGTVISSVVSIGSGIIYHLITVAIASSVVFMVLSGGNIMNDVLDAEIDSINHPERPIPSGMVTKRSATYLYLTLYAVALIVSLSFLPLISFPVVFAAEILLILYEYKGKKMGLPGNMMISALIGAIFLYGGIVFYNPERLFLMFLLAFLSNVSRELIKDVQDMEGDVDRKTFPKVHGKKAALDLSSVFIIMTICISVFPYILGILSIYYLIAVIICDISFILTMIMQYSDYKKGQNMSKLSMMLGLLSFTVGGVF